MIGCVEPSVLIRSEDESLIIGAIIRLNMEHLPAREARSRCRSGLGASVVKAMLRRVDGLTLRQWKLNHDPPDEPAITVVPAEAGTYTP
jgi:hypothetical protein